MNRSSCPASCKLSLQGPAITNIAVPTPALGNAAFMLEKAPGVAPVQSTTSCACDAAGKRNKTKTRLRHNLRPEFIHSPFSSCWGRSGNDKFRAETLMDTVKMKRQRSRTGTLSGREYSHSRNYPSRTNNVLEVTETESPDASATRPLGI